MIVQESAIKRYFDKRTLTRGIEYFHEERVVEIVPESQGDGIWMIDSVVAGSERYEQEIVINARGEIVSTYCTCPVYYRCKHCAAALWKLAHTFVTLKDSYEQKIDRWVEDYLSLRQPQNNLLGSEEERNAMLIVRLFENPYESFTLYKKRRLKSGKWSRGSKLSNQRLFDRYESYRYELDFLNTTERALMEMLRDCVVHSRFGDAYVLAGKHGAQTLRRIVELGIGYFGDARQPLRWEEQKIALSLKWHKDKEGYYSIAPALGTQQLLLLETDPPMCIDSERMVLCEIASPHSHEMLQHLFGMPPIPWEKLSYLFSALTQKGAMGALPLPEGMEISHISEKPKTYARFYRVREGDGEARVLSVRVLYGAHRVDPMAPGTDSYVQHEGSIVHIERDTAYESALAERIASWGLTYTPAIGGYLSYADPDIHTARQRWIDIVSIEIPRLREEGWQIEIEDGFAFDVVEPESWIVQSEEEEEGWFSLSYKIRIAGREIPLVPVVRELLEAYDPQHPLPETLYLPLENGEFLKTDSQRIAPILRTLFDLFDHVDEDRLTLNAYEAHLLDTEDSALEWKGSEELKTLSHRLRDFQGIEPVEPAPTLNASLRAYQHEGISWMHFLHSYRFGGILADDMGLGKTVQTLAFVQMLRYQGGLDAPVLIVVPTSLLGNWREECARFTPDLRLLTLYGPGRHAHFETIAEHDIVLTTYALMQRDEAHYEKQSFHMMVLDEAQKIKNPRAKMTRAAKSIHARFRLALSGTPMENHLGELWSIFDFVMPGFLGSERDFKQRYRTPIEEQGDTALHRQLNRRIAPFMLRRTKEEVASELPPKTEIVRKASMGARQAALYESIRITTEQEVRDAIAAKGLARSHLHILEALLKLRQVCCHPGLLKIDAAQAVKESAKLTLFLELLEELMEEKRKVLVFSQFTSMLSILEKEIKARGYRYTKLTGATRKREEAIANFTDGKADIFLISLKAGGTGLNLVQADTVIHYDPWWNPAVEHQATDRAYRIGQDKPVFVYKLIVEGSIEEKIMALQEQKQARQDALHRGAREEREMDSKALLDVLGIR